MESKHVTKLRRVAETSDTMKVRWKRLNSVGRNCLDAELEEVACCVYNMCQKMLHVNVKIVIFKANKIFDHKTNDRGCRDTLVVS